VFRHFGIISCGSCNRNSKDGEEVVEEAPDGDVGAEGVDRPAENEEQNEEMVVEDVAQPDSPLLPP
jgi:hypothetical protein